MTSDMISRRSLLLQLAKTFVPANGLGQGIAMGVDYAIKAIGEAPAVDAVEVVRCKDCKHCSQNTPDGLHWCEENEIGALMDDDFCSYGERRADDA